MISSLVFLKGRDTPLASAFLRCDQLSEIVAPGLAARGVAASVRTDIEGVGRALVVVNKTFLTRYTPLAILRLRRRGAVIACDFVDRPPDPRICAMADILIASSHAQAAYFEATYPGAPVVHVPHHADLRITARVDAAQPARMAYFGELGNALHLDVLAAQGFCDAVAVDSVHDIAWLSRLGDYRCHYAVRARRAWNGFKPFTKGAVAATVGAVVVTDRNAETLEALGADYPFFTPSLDRADVRATVETVLASPHTAAWAAAERAMQRVREACSRQVIQAAFDRMLALDGPRRMGIGRLRRRA